jgi:hypothetical protein
MNETTVENQMGALREIGEGRAGEQETGNGGTLSDLPLHKFLVEIRVIT